MCKHLRSLASGPFPENSVDCRKCDFRPILTIVDKCNKNELVRWGFTAQVLTNWFKSGRPRLFFQLWLTGLLNKMRTGDNLRRTRTYMNAAPTCSYIYYKCSVWSQYIMSPPLKSWWGHVPLFPLESASMSITEPLVVRSQKKITNNFAEIHYWFFDVSTT